MYQRMRGRWRTPKGNWATFEFRADTNDWNTIQSAVGEDEYGLAALDLGAVTAWDIGAHLGSVSIALAVDNPDLAVVAVEAIPENAELVRINARLNGVADRVHIINGAASDERELETIAFGYTESENGRHHAFIGNTGIVGPEAHTELDVPAHSLASMVWEYGTPAFVKIDCEGCEWRFLADEWVTRLPLIIGEWHPTGHTRDDLVAMLADSHDVTFSGPEVGPGGFVAVRR